MSKLQKPALGTPSSYMEHHHNKGHHQLMEHHNSKGHHQLMEHHQMNHNHHHHFHGF
ncbi:hypothetical protein LSTR_LSTR006648 [Laodelphax striatellus]|uniref:Uncharacterized protein n=1 Tax=Laodelphax striatellus TaxID=195883 RepID=A0A482X7Z8_LAOST|nr:hypothetical protein LSTR_LSTR006648 [Laodelphax striatellus]